MPESNSKTQKVAVGLPSRISSFLLRLSLYHQINESNYLFLYTITLTIAEVSKESPVCRDTFDRTYTGVEENL